MGNKDSYISRINTGVWFERKKVHQLHHSDLACYFIYALLYSLTGSCSLERTRGEVLPCMVLLSNKEAVAQENSSSSGMDAPWGW